MRIATPGTVAILAIFLTFQTVYFVTESFLHLFFPKKMTQKWLVLFQYLIAPVFIGTLGLILIPNIFQIHKDIHGDVFANETANTSCNSKALAEIDADIGGYGIRIAIWAQEFVVFFIALAGTFHSKVTGAKEIGAGLIITHFSLAVALIVQLVQFKGDEGDAKGRKILTSASAILGAMILDSQNSALSILLITKQTLAARWQVVIVIFCQTVSMVLIPILVEKYTHHQSDEELALDANKCELLQVFWWGRLRNFPYETGETTYRYEATAFWLYYSFRLVVYIQSSFHALINTQIFHEAEKSNDPLEGITHPSLGRRDAQGRNWSGKIRRWLRGHSEDMRFDPYPTTISLMYIVYGVLMVASMAAAEITIGGPNKIFEQKDGQTVSTGQVIAIVVAAVTIARGLWLFFMLFIKDGEIKSIKEGLGSFRWPLHLEFDDQE
ncbi:hypothetical protein CPAR01_04247 [Colletotrichum paranaense]|uniref:Integral membrane protein n=1 Tax=Colletotrichum paranaense TaxID=1914294 RepID=A0ABQ9SVS2_9PEZI|nr:uncharacterized protein CPAR01_04247 [Colletotrichum paranaense]KAK1543614.1 hypothetical protein CPAR01_04247 [Colletotrichum paranaense]